MSGVRTRTRSWWWPAGRASPPTSCAPRPQRDGTTAAVHLLGARTDVPDLVAAADVFVAPSRWEGLGSAVVEAMGIGTPIVASDVAAIRETAPPGVALLVPPDRPDLLGAAIAETLDDPGAARSRADQGLARFADSYTIERVTDQMIQVLRTGPRRLTERVRHLTLAPHSAAATSAGSGMSSLCALMNTADATRAATNRIAPQRNATW